MSVIVQLRAAKIPVIGFLAVHYWFVIIKDKHYDRWEIWQTKNVGKISWGHLHKNLMFYDHGVGNGPSWLEHEWTGKTAELLAEIIENSPKNYPHNHYYLYWPGPNSNTYIQSILNQAKTNYFLSPWGIGKDYLGLIGWQKIGQVIHFSTPLFGFKFIWPKVFEIHILTLTIKL
jgi:Protein of unknown function (DUF3750)